jgi:hypothetical protein
LYRAEVYKAALITPSNPVFSHHSHRLNVAYGDVASVSHNVGVVGGEVAGNQRVNLSHCDIVYEQELAFRPFRPLNTL